VDHHGLSGSDVGISGSCSDGESGVGIISGSGNSSGSSRLASSFPSSTFPLSSGGPSSTRGARSNSVLTILAILTMLALSVTATATNKPLTHSKSVTQRFIHACPCEK
jgi:hypothetical protein